MLNTLYIINRKIIRISLIAHEFIMFQDKYTQHIIYNDTNKSISSSIEAAEQRHLLRV